MSSTVDDVKDGVEKSPPATVDDVKLEGVVEESPPVSNLNLNQGDVEMEALQIEEAPILRRIDI